MLCTLFNIGQKNKNEKNENNLGFRQLELGGSALNKITWILAWFEGVFLRTKFKSEPGEKK